MYSQFLLRAVLIFILEPSTSTETSGKFLGILVKEM